jgi:hypothetical protein
VLNLKEAKFTVGHQFEKKSKKEVHPHIVDIGQPIEA